MSFAILAHLSVLGPGSVALALALALALLLVLVYFYQPFEWKIKPIVLRYSRRCPRCAEQGIETWVLAGKHCPRCNQPC